MSTLDDSEPDGWDRHPWEDWQDNQDALKDRNEQGTIWTIKGVILPLISNREDKLHTLDFIATHEYYGGPIIIHGGGSPTAGYSFNLSSELDARRLILGSPEQMDQRLPTGSTYLPIFEEKIDISEEKVFFSASRELYIGHFSDCNPPRYLVMEE
jgi:hypothetical protein